MTRQPFTTSKAVVGIALAGLFCTQPVHAQDSVSTTPGLPGDAIDAYRTAPPSEQVNDYVVDLSPLASSWGARFAVGPLVKAGRSTSTQYFNHLIGSQAVSNAMANHVSRLRSSYLAWRAMGQGVNGTNNSAPADDGSGRFGPVFVEGLAHRFGTAFMEFSGGPDSLLGNGDDDCNIVAASVEFSFREPNRLFVSRLNAAHSKLVAAGVNTATATMGLGAVDESLNVHLLADGFGLVSGVRLSDKNYYRIAAATRDPARVNRLSQSGAIDASATTRLLQTSTVLSTPAMLSSVLPGGAGRAVLVAADFASRLVSETSAGVTTTSTALNPGGAGSVRGSLAVTQQVFAFAASGGMDAATGAILSRTGSGASARTRAMNILSLNTDGSADGAGVMQIVLPTTPALLVDPTDGYAPATFFPGLADHEFTGYQGQAPFRGGNAPISLVVLPDGDLLASAVVVPGASGGGGAGGLLPAAPDNYIAVVRLDAETGEASWTIAAHTGSASGAVGGFSKAILGDYGVDGIPGTSDAGEADGSIDATPIGRVALYNELAVGAGHGPSISAPALDRLGNIYFIASVRLNGGAGPVMTSALIRANYTPSESGAGEYELELIAKAGDVVAGANSTRNYKIAFLGAADGDSADSGSLWHSSIVQDLVPGIRPETIEYGSSRSLGALVFRAKLVYDRNSDGQFNDPSGGSGGDDQAYNTMMVLMPRVVVGDFNRDGVLDSQDFFDFLDAFFTGDADYNDQDATDSQDYFDFINDFFGG